VLLQLSCLCVVIDIRMTSSQTTYDVNEPDNDVSSSGCWQEMVSQLVEGMSQLHADMTQLKAANSQLKADIDQLKAAVVHERVTGKMSRKAI